MCFTWWQSAMNAEREPLSPRQRLMLSRQALIAQLMGDQAQADVPDGDPGQPPHRARTARRHDWSAVAGQVIRRWWRRHPANAAGQIARPLLGRYAQEHPLTLIAAAAGAGALIAFAKPWRLLSISAALAAVLKTSDVADLVTTLMKSTQNLRPSATPKNTPND
jgi:hypothetical protein